MKNKTKVEIPYRGYFIVTKRDFPLKSKETGFVVTDGICNIMPGGCWFVTIEEAQHAIRVFKRVNGNSTKFWEVMHPFTYTRLGQKSELQNATVSQGRFWAVIENFRVVKLGSNGKEVA